MPRTRIETRPSDGLEAAIAAMKRGGISDADIDTPMRKNPARLLGLN